MVKTHSLSHIDINVTDIRRSLALPSTRASSG
jgi:hypothetical protein